VRIRESSFSRNPVGSGPFVFQALRPIDPAASRAVLQLTKNADYYRGGMRLDRFQLQTYKSHDELRQGFLSREINAAVELSTTDIDTITQEAPTTVVADARMNNGVYAFFRTDNPVLSDASVRHALVLATDRKAIIKSLKGLAGDLQGPLVEDQIKSVAGIKQDVFNLDKAAELLDKAGWVKKGAVRVKAEQKLQLTIVAPKSGDFPQVTEMVSSEWRKLGVDVRTQLVDTATFEQNIVKPRAYDVLLYELALGADPDVFAYWHSSQATVKGYNLSNYKSGVADDALVSARSRSETALRAAKYAAFFRQWLSDAPAVALYRPHLHYVTTDSTTSVKSSDTVVDALGRYNMLDQWTVRLEDQFKTP
jgi:peptide/nickel transport system substrate-binding protein